MRQHVFWIALMMAAASVSSWLVLRQFRSEISALRDDMNKNNRAIAALAKGINSKLATHHE